MMAPPLAVPAVHALLHLALGQLGVIVQAAPEVALCPAADQVRTVIARQLGGDRDAMVGWTIRYQPAGPSALDVEVTDPSSVVRARRQVVAGGGDRDGCAVAAETVAAIGVRALRPIEWTRAEAPESSPAVTAAAPAPPPQGATPDPTRSRVTLATGPAFVSAPTASANVLVDVGVRISGPIKLRMGGLLLPMRGQESAGRAGAARLTRTTFFAGLTWIGHERGLALEAGPALGVSFDSAQTANISEPGAGRRTALAGGLLAGVALPLHGRWRIGVAGALLGRLAASDFSVTTADREALALRPPALSVFAALRVECTFFP